MALEKGSCWAEASYCGAKDHLEYAFPTRQFRRPTALACPSAIRLGRETMANEIKTGSVVKLKSGGSKMTVEAIFLGTRGTIWVRCSWFDDTKRISQTFDLDAVELT
jgi:uncharacterized protein YodC (DUF2158 family)